MKGYISTWLPSVPQAKNRIYATDSNNDHARNPLAGSEKINFVFPKKVCYTQMFYITILGEWHQHLLKFTGMCAPGYGNKLRRSKCMVFWGCKGGGGKRVDVYVPWTMQLSLCHLLSIPQCSFYNTKSQNKMKKKEMELNAYLLSWSIYLFFEKYFLNT